MIKIRLLFLFLCFRSLLIAQITEHIPRSHAHNDYEKIRPALYAALRQGFVSVEVDIFPYGAKNQLRVSHIPLFLWAKPSLEKLYFRRIERWLERYGQFYQDSSQRLILMIDIKRDGAETYRRLKPLLHKYAHLISHRDRSTGQIFYKKVDILLSGSKPYQELAADSLQYAFLDGHFGNIADPNYPSGLCPRVSSSHRSELKSNRLAGKNPTELAKLSRLVQNAHSDGRQIRFWAMPDRKKLWLAHWEAGTDWLNVDKIRKFNRFYHQRLKKQANNLHK